MRLSELLKAEVFDADGVSVGRVHDVRFVRDGPAQGAFGPAYRLQGLIVGSGSVGVRLGFDRAPVKGPWPMKLVFRLFHRNTRLVEWPAVATIRGRAIRLKVPAGDLRPVPDLKG